MYTAYFSWVTRYQLYIPRVTVHLSFSRRFTQVFFAETIVYCITDCIGGRGHQRPIDCNALFEQFFVQQNSVSCFSIFHRGPHLGQRRGKEKDNIFQPATYSSVFCAAHWIVLPKRHCPGFTFLLGRTIQCAALGLAGAFISRQLIDQ